MEEEKMCLGVMAKVDEINGKTATVNFGGVKKEVILASAGISKGDFVMIHAGMIIGKLSQEEFLQNLAIYRDLLAQNYVDSGDSEEKAGRRASEEVHKLLQSLGIDEDLPSIEEEVKEMEEEEKIPENAFRGRYRVTLSDTDYLQVMHYTNYLRYCERAQQELLNSIGMGYYTLIHRFGVFIPTVETALKVKGPVRIDNEIEVAVWVEEIGNKHLKFKSVIKNLTSGKKVAECTTVSISADVGMMESMPLPAELKEKIAKYLAQT
ncbi:MAG: HypC/HybG/HupF family hydrogenase formation chaperone [Candidatus Hadarchaeales archaeon]